MATPVKLRSVSGTRTARCAPFPAAFAALLLLLVLLMAFGCSKDVCHGTLVNGQCQPSCDETQCRAGARCLQNECRASCTGDAQCEAGQVCRLWGFADQTRGNYCVVLPNLGGAGGGPMSEAGALPEAGANAPCTSNADCTALAGAACVSGTCRPSCATHAECGGLGECLTGVDSDGNNGYYCDLSRPQAHGQFYAHCPSGTNAECDSANGFLCVGAGAGDLDGYCTRDCADDTSCADGFFCAALDRPACADACGFQGAPKDPSCIPVAQIGDGKPYQCGLRGATRNVCRPRKFCSPCTTDADCFAVPNQICAKDQSGQKICTEPCDPAHPSCPWGDAAACGMWDKDLGRATCAHRFGKCAGSGKGCEPCVRDADCGSRGACTGSSFSGEHWCVDLSVKCSCGESVDANGTCVGGGCPSSPSGLDMICVDSPSSTITGACFGANTASIIASSGTRAGCWPSH